MKKRILAILLTLALAAAIAIPTALPVSAATTGAAPPSWASTSILWAGQNMNAGTLYVWNIGTTLYVDYQTTAPWTMSETHLQIATSLAGIPQANGNPIPGHFAMGDTLKSGATWDYFTYNMGTNKSFDIAAQAEVSKPGDSETAWAGCPSHGYPFPGKNWATYTTYSPIALNFTTGLDSYSNPLPGSLGAGFTITTGGVAGTMHVLTLDSPSAIPPLKDGNYAFKLTPTSGQVITLENYFAAKSGWNSGMETQIDSEITGSTTFFSLNASSGTYTLVDAFKQYLGTSYAPYPLTIDDDYPAGTYSYTGTLTAVNGSTLLVTVKLIVTTGVALRADPEQWNVPSTSNPAEGYVMVSADNVTHMLNLSINLTGGVANTTYYVFTEEYTGPTPSGSPQWTNPGGFTGFTTNGSGIGTYSVSIPKTSLNGAGPIYYLQIVLANPWGVWGVNDFGTGITTIVIN